MVGIVRDFTVYISIVMALCFIYLSTQMCSEKLIFLCGSLACICIGIAFGLTLGMEVI